MPTLTLRPSGNGPVNNFGAQTPASGLHYEKVDEAATDDDTTYVSYSGLTLTAFRRELYVHAGAIGAGLILAVRVFYRIKNTGTDTTHVQAAVKTHAAYYYESLRSVVGALAWTTYNKEWTTNPFTGNAWTWDELNDAAFCFGIQLRSSAGSGAKSLTWCYVEVDYLVASSGGNVGIGGCGGNGMMF